MDSRRIAIRWLPWILLVLIATGCAIGNTHTFNFRPPAGPDQGHGITVLVFAVADQRPDIVSGDEPPAWVGEQRGGFGNPFNVLTTSGRPFAEIVAETIGRDLGSAGFRVIVSAEKAPEDVGAFLAGQEAKRGLAVVMRKFNSNTYTNIDVEWYFEATVYDHDGEVLHKNTEFGKETLEGSVMNPPKAAKQKVPPFFYEKIHALITGDAKMVEALTSG